MPTASAKYVDVLLPLAMPAPLTYVLPASLAAEVTVGSRVVVPLGKRKQYAGLVIRLHNEAPAGSYDVRPIVEVVDTTPLLLPEQWKLWEWISLYYICTPGEVMKAALPAGLKLESEMCVSRAADFDPSTPLTNAGVPAASGLGTEHAGEEDTQLAIDQRHIPASEDLQGGEAEMEA